MEIPQLMDVSGVHLETNQEHTENSFHNLLTIMVFAASSGRIHNFPQRINADYPT